MASIVQHQHTHYAKPDFAVHQISSGRESKGRKPRPADADRVEAIVRLVVQAGAATIKDVAHAMGLHPETIRRHLVTLVDGERLIVIEEAVRGACALYALSQADGAADTPEYDQSRTSTTAWPRGQHGRDPLVAAMFGAPAGEVHA